MRLISSILPLAFIFIACSSDGGSATIPTAPTTLKAEKLGTGVHLTWTDTSTNEDEFMIMRKDGAASYVEITRVPFNTVQFHDDPVTAGTLYTYMVMATNAAGDVGSNEVTITP